MRTFLLLNLVFLASLAWATPWSTQFAIDYSYKEGATRCSNISSFSQFILSGERNGTRLQNAKLFTWMNDQYQDAIALSPQELSAIQLGHDILGTWWIASWSLDAQTLHYFLTHDFAVSCEASQTFRTVTSPLNFVFHLKEVGISVESPHGPAQFFQGLLEDGIPFSGTLHILQQRSIIEH